MALYNGKYRKYRKNPICIDCGKKLKNNYALRCGHCNGINNNHIDYDKKNNNESNFISLCSACYSRTNFNREYWRKRYVVFQHIQKY